MAPFSGRSLVGWIFRRQSPQNTFEYWVGSDPSARRATGDHKFGIGQAVQFSPQSARVTSGLYVITGLLPERDGEFEYCIYNEAERYQHVAKESELR